MDKEALFDVLSTQDATTLLGLLTRAYDQMQYEQRRAVFGHLMKRAPVDVDAETLLDEVEVFRRESLARAYYAPFNVNSKNYRHIPEKTRVWFDKLSDLLDAGVRLTARGDHRHAVACFTMLYELIGAIEMGEEVVFAHELGSWMIHGDEKQFIAAYMTSLAAIATPEEFAAAALPLIRRDGLQSFTTQAYAAAIAAATDAQRDDGCNARTCSGVGRLVSTSMIVRSSCGASAVSARRSRRPRSNISGRRSRTGSSFPLSSSGT